jgi:hypothetical protein
VHIKKLDNNEVGKKESLTIHACLFDALSVNISHYASLLWFALGWLTF